MQTIEFQLAGEYVELCNLLKLTGIADSGGRGKALVAEGSVTVDGRPESRKAAKIRAGQVVECLGLRIGVVGVQAATSSPDGLP
jgi:ribosome-associated protein